jgi:Ferredoxin subunits of nitrite reductase and ring-hydroxylating dioxygenases
MKCIKVAQTNELRAGDKKKISWVDKEILLVNIQNSYYAIDNTCPHMGGSLYEGKLEGSHIICPRHGSIFDVTSSKVVESGTMFHIKVKVHDLHSYPIRVEGNDILLEID